MFNKRLSSITMGSPVGYLTNLNNNLNNFGRPTFNLNRTNSKDLSDDGLEAKADVFFLFDHLIV